MGAPGGLRNIGSPDRELKEPAPRVRPGAEGPGPRAGPGAGGHRVRGEEARTPHALQKSLRSQSPSVQLHTRCLAHTSGPRSTHHLTGHVVFPALGVPPPRLPGPQLAVLGPGLLTTSHVYSGAGQPCGPSRAPLALRRSPPSSHGSLAAPRRLSPRWSPRWALADAAPPQPCGHSARPG